MNESAVRTQQTENGHIGQYRLCWRSDFFTVEYWNNVEGKLMPRYFKNPLIAELYAWREKHERESSKMVRDGVTIASKADVDAYFDMSRVNGRVSA